MVLTLSGNLVTKLISIEDSLYFIRTWYNFVEVPQNFCMTALCDTF